MIQPCSLIRGATRWVVLGLAVTGGLIACDESGQTETLGEEPLEQSTEIQPPELPTEANQVVLTLALPLPRFEGTPKNVEEPNMEPPRKGARKPLLVPEGLTNLALGKPISGSDEEPMLGDLEQIADGDKEGGDGSFVVLGFGMQYIQIDLGAEYDLYAVVIWHFHGEARAYRDVIVRVGNDPDFIAEPTTLFNNDHDNSSGQGIGSDYQYFETFEGKIIDAASDGTPTRGRYIRLYSNGNTSNNENHYTEVEVYGKPVS